MYKEWRLLSEAYVYSPRGKAQWMRKVPGAFPVLWQVPALWSERPAV